MSYKINKYIYAIVCKLTKLIIMNMYNIWKFADLLCTVFNTLGGSVCKVLIRNLKHLYPNLLITGIVVKEKNGQWAAGKIPHPLAVPHGNAANAVRIQTYQGLLRDLRTRSKTCRRTQSKLNLTSTSSLRLWKYLGDSWGRLCWKLPRRHAKLYFWC